MIFCCRPQHHGGGGTAITGASQTRSIRGNHSQVEQDKPAGLFTWGLRLDTLDSSKVTEFELGRMRELVRPWLKVTRAETSGQSGQTNFTLTASSLACLAIGNCVSTDVW